MGSGLSSQMSLQVPPLAPRQLRLLAGAASSDLKQPPNTSSGLVSREAELRACSHLQGIVSREAELQVCSRM